MKLRKVTITHLLIINELRELILELRQITIHFPTITSEIRWLMIKFP